MSGADALTATLDIAWEARHGPVPVGGFVALRTGWPQRWPSREHMLNAGRNGVFHYPGWSLPVLRTLFEARGVTACGHETTNTDPRVAVSRGDASPERYVPGTGHCQIKLLTGPGELPGPTRSPWPPGPGAPHGPGFPARVFAICQEG